MGADGDVVVDRKRAWEWEWFDFESIDHNANEIGNNFIEVNNISSVYNKIYLNGFNYKFLSNYISMLPEHERTALDFMCGGILGEHIH
ncbi:hypothetical protein [Asaia prunellae]|uniref:hypothetical protein n=1 Tax=Asaia prunellae TaxID=610245 RepID=UPI0011DCB9AF|nr:hypothetical protein [Asaia prunellae]